MSLSRRDGPRRAFRRPGRSGRIRSYWRLSAAGVGSRLAIGARHFRVGTRAHLAAGPGRHIRRSRADPADERGRPARDAAHPAGQPRQLPRAVRRRSRPDRRVQDLADRAHKQRGERLHDITDASPQISNAVDRAGRFLSLASLVSVLLCAIAVAMSARRYVHRHLDTVALLKTLGATRAFTLSVTLAAAAGRGAVCRRCWARAVGFLAQEWLLRTIRGLLARASCRRRVCCPPCLGFMTAIAVLVGFALPPLLQLVARAGAARAAPRCRAAAAADAAGLRAGRRGGRSC